LPADLIVILMAAERAKRLGYIDVARAVAVLLMIEIHCFNSWVVGSQRGSQITLMAAHAPIVLC
jgi:uncharacterized membrane protein